MALNDGLLNIGADAMAAAATHLSLHSAAPDATGSNAVGTRVAAGWPAATGGDLTVSNKAFTGLPASSPVTHVGFWSAATAGTFRGFYPLTGDQAANAAGEYTINSITLNGSSS